MNFLSSAVGGSLLIVCSLFLGADKGKREKEKIEMTESLILFVEYISQQIEAFRAPLGDIFQKFSDERLDKAGFCEILRTDGIGKAVAHIEDKLPYPVVREMHEFSKALGGGYEKGQVSLCEYVCQRLQDWVNNGKSRLNEKMRMYRLMPVLLALSLIILLL